MQETDLIDDMASETLIISLWSNEINFVEYSKFLPFADKINAINVQNRESSGHLITTSKFLVEKTSKYFTSLIFLLIKQP